MELTCKQKQTKTMRKPGKKKKTEAGPIHSGEGREHEQCVGHKSNAKAGRGERVRLSVA